MTFIQILALARWLRLRSSLRISIVEMTLDARVCEYLLLIHGGGLSGIIGLSPGSRRTLAEPRL